MSPVRRSSKKKTPLAVRLAIVVGGLVLLAAGGYFLLVQPNKAKVAELDKEIGDISGEIDRRRQASTQAAGLSKILVADFFRLQTAMPDNPQVPEIHLQIDEIARATGVSYDGIRTAQVIDSTSYQVLPFELTFQGTFYDLSDFLRRLQSLVLVQNNKLSAKGRLFTADQVGFTEGDKGFPNIKATVRIYAYSFGHPLAVEGATSASPSGGEGAPEGNQSTTTTPAEGDSTASATEGGVS